jgi:hypothetical protein
LFLTSAHPPCETPDPAAERTERHLQMLQELGELGMRLARAVTEQAVETAAEPDRDLGLVFSRIARAVRQTIALEAKLAEDRRKAETETAERRATETRRRAVDRKTKVRLLVERVLDAEADGSDAENLFYDLGERLETDYDDADFAERPIGELVQRICKDLGVTADPSLWQDDDRAIEEAQAATPSGGIDPPGADDLAPAPVRVDIATDRPTVPPD